MSDTKDPKDCADYLGDRIPGGCYAAFGEHSDGVLYYLHVGIMADDLTLRWRTGFSGVLRDPVSTVRLDSMITALEEHLDSSG